MGITSSPSWLLLIHQLPPKPDYVRVKTRRRLSRLGSIAIKNTVYALPNREAQVEDFHWLLKEIQEAGGEAYLCTADMIEGLTNADVTALFNGARDADYADLADAMKEFLREARATAADPDVRQKLKTDYSKLRDTFEERTAIDFFGAPKRSACETLLQQIESVLQEAAAGPALQVVKTAKATDFQKRTWVTRSDVFVDRIASAWLIRRHVDTKARFKFVNPSSYKPSAREVRFDMYDAEFTHVGDRCTFEVLLDAFSLDDLSLRVIGEIVHDLDLKDAKFHRNEAFGLEAILHGLTRTHPSDPARIEQGLVLLDALYAQFTNQEEPRGKNRRSTTV